MDLKSLIEKVDDNQLEKIGNVILKSKEKDQEKLKKIIKSKFPKISNEDIEIALELVKG